MTVLASAYVVASFFWTGEVGAKERCIGVSLNVNDEGDTLKFVTPQFLQSEMKRMGFNLTGRPLSEIRTKTVEDRFNKQYYVEHVECFKCSDRTVRLEVWPVKPVMRVFDSSGSYYINREGKRVPSMPEIFVDVPVVKGNFSGQFPPQRLLPLIDRLTTNECLRHLVSSVEVADSANVFIVPNIAGHVINLGTLGNLDAKIAKLMRMYREVLPVKGWLIYDTINLKWNNQVVATKRNATSRLWIQDENIGHEEEPEPINQN